MNLIWSDLSTPAHLWGCFVVVAFAVFEGRASSSRGSFGRRLISLIFACRSRIIMIRRELPLTKSASPAKPVAVIHRGFSFELAPAAAGSAFELGCVVHTLRRFCFFILWKVFAFAFVVASRQAAICCLAATAASALVPMNQMKPSSSRPTAVMILR